MIIGCVSAWQAIYGRDYEKVTIIFSSLHNFISVGNEGQKTDKRQPLDSSAPWIINLHCIYPIIIIYSTSNYLLILTSVPSSGRCSTDYCHYLLGTAEFWKSKWLLQVLLRLRCWCWRMNGCPKDMVQSWPPQKELCPATHSTGPGLWHDDTRPWWWLIMLFSSLL